MKRFSILVLVACGGNKPASTPATAAPTCVSYDAAKTEEKAVADRNEASFQRALAEQGLKEPDFAADYFDARDDQSHEWQVVEASGARTLLAPPSYMACDVSNPWRLAQDGSGNVSALVITPRETAAKVVTICGCASDVPVTCDPSAKRPVRWRWAMSSTATWKGPLSIVVDHEAIKTTFECR